MKTICLSMSQALLHFLSQQYIAIDDQEYKFVQGVLGIFGHGNVTGLGEALQFEDCQIPFIRANNEQGMVHTATAFAKQKNRLGIYACTSSIGPGATNMITGAAAATANRIPVLLLPGDIFACRQPDPVLQQIEIPHDYTITVNDCFKAVSRYWDRIVRPEQLMTACLNAFRVLTDPVETGAVTLALPQDVQAEVYDYPAHFFEKRVWRVERREPDPNTLQQAARALRDAKRPLIIAGGGVHYSLACDALQQFAEQHAIPVAETQAGKSAMAWDNSMSVGGIGVTGTASANALAKQADVILAIGSRLQDFTTMSKLFFSDPKTTLIQLNVDRFDAHKMDALCLQADAKQGLAALHKALTDFHSSEVYQTEVKQLKNNWDAEVDRLYALSSEQGNTQTSILGAINNFVSKDDVIVCAAGSLPGDLHRLWRSQQPKDYHLEYAYSCMGYEVAGGLGIKLATPDGEVYVIVGDGSYLMLHSELLTSIQENKKINIILLDNYGFQCIKNLQTSQGGNNFGNERRFRDPKNNQLDGDYIPVDFCQYAAALGAKTYAVNNTQELTQALADAKHATVSTLIEIKTLPGTMTDGYDAWWRVGVSPVSKQQNVVAAHQDMQKHIDKARKY